MSRKEAWYENESIHAYVSDPDPVKDEPGNQEILSTCGKYVGGVKLRIIWGAYGPGTAEKKRQRYYWMSGESATVVCRDVDTANWFRNELKNFIRDMDGVILDSGGVENDLEKD